MKEKQKPQLDCGVDGINIMFATNYELEQDIYHFTRNECNKKIEYATLKKIKATNEQIEYALYVNLPKILRKGYNKLREQLEHESDTEKKEQIKQQMEEEGILRFEWILNKRGVNRILGNNTTLWSVLSANSIKTLIDSYKKQLFETDQLYDRMNRLGRDIRYVMRKDAQCYNPKEFVLAHKDVCELDYSFIKYGLTEKYGGNKRTARKTASRLKSELKNQINFTEGLIEEGVL